MFAHTQDNPLGDVILELDLSELGNNVDGRHEIMRNGVCVRFDKSGRDFYFQISSAQHTVRIKGDIFLNNFNLESDGGIELEAHINAHQKIVVIAKNILNKRELRADKIKIHAHDVYENQGKVKAKSEEDISAATLGNAGKMKLAGISTVRARYLIVEGAGKFGWFRQSDYLETSRKIEIEGQVYVDDQASLGVFNGSLVARYLDVGGSLHAGHATVKVGELKTYENSHVEGCHLSLTAPLAVIGGQFASSGQSNLSLDRVTVKGQLTVKFSGMQSSSVLVDAGGVFCVTDKSTLLVPGTLQIDGKASWHNASVTTDRLTSYGSLTTKESTVIVKEYLHNGGQLHLNKMTLNSPYVDFGGAYKVISSHINSRFITDEGNGNYESTNLNTIHWDVESEASVTMSEQSIAKTEFSLLGGDISCNWSSIGADVILHEQGTVTLEKESVLLIRDMMEIAPSAVLSVQSGSMVGDREKDASNKARVLVDGMLVINQGGVNVDTLSVSGSIDAVRSLISARSQTSLSGENQVFLESHILTSHMSISGHAEFQKKTLVKAGELLVLSRGQVDATDHVTLKVGRRARINGLINLNDSEFIAKNVAALGKVTAKSTRIVATEKTTVGSSGELHLDESTLTTPQLSVRNTLRAVNAELNVSGAVRLLYGAVADCKRILINAGEEISLALKSHLSGESIHLKAATFENAGIVQCDGLIINAVDVDNSAGYIDAGKMLNIEADRSINNLMGVMRAGHTNLSSLIIFNMMGDIAGYSDLRLTSTITVNVLGLRRGYQVSSNTFFDLNIGLDLPSFPNGWRDIFSTNHLVRYSQFVLTTALPDMSNTITLGYMLAPHAMKVVTSSINGMQMVRQQGWQAAWNEAVNTAVSGWNEVKKLATGTASQFREGRLVTVVSIKDTMVAAKNAYQMSQCVYGECAGLSGQGLGERWGDYQLLSLVTSFGRAVGPSMTRDSLVSVNAGVITSLNILNTDREAFNFGIYAGLQSLTHNSGRMYNSGVQYGSQLNLSGREFDNSGLVQNSSRMYLNFASIDNSEGGSIVGMQGKIKATKFSNKGSLYFSGAIVSGDVADIGGIFNATNTRLHFDTSIRFDEGAIPLRTQNVEIRTKNFSLKKPVVYQGALKLEADQLHASPEADISLEVGGDEGFVHFKAREFDYNGSANIDNALIEVDSLEDANDLIQRRGRYSQFQVTKQLGLKTEGTVDMHSSIDRACGLDIESAAIDLSENYHTDHHVRFRTTKGDIRLPDNLTATNITVDAAQGVHARQSLVGKRIIINARVGNIENKGGIISALQYLQATAAGNISNLCKIYTVNDRYGSHQAYSAGVMSGGSGEGNDGIGLYVHADGKVINSGSVFHSDSGGHVDGTMGVESTALSSTYISEKSTQRSIFGTKKKSTTLSPLIQYAAFTAPNAGMYLGSGEGSVNAVGTNFVTKDGVKIYAKRDIGLFALQHKEVTTKKRTGLFGSSKSTAMHEGASVTLIQDNGYTRLESAEGSILGRGVIPLGDGDFDAIAPNGSVEFDSLKLQHRVQERSKGFGLTSQTLNALREGVRTHGASVVTSVMPTVGKLDSLLSARNQLEVATSTSNAALAAYNDYQLLNNSGLKGLLTGRIVSTFAPSVDLMYHTTRSDMAYETTAPNGLFRRNIQMIAKDKVLLGVDVSVAGHMSIKASTITFQGVALDASSSYSKRTFSAGVSTSGVPVHASAGFSQGWQQATSYQHAQIYVGGNLELQADTLIEDAAHFNAETISGEVKRHIINSRQDSRAESSATASLSSTRMSAYGRSKHESLRTTKISGMHVREGINHDDQHRFIVGDTINTGGAITSDGLNLYASTRIENHDLVDYDRRSSFGVAFSSHIEVVSVSVSKQHFEAMLMPVYYGSAGTVLDIQHCINAMHTESADGYKVICDKKRKMTIDVPIVHPGLFVSKSSDELSVVEDEVGEEVLSTDVVFEDKFMDEAEVDVVLDHADKSARHIEKSTNKSVVVSKQTSISTSVYGSDEDANAINDAIIKLSEKIAKKVRFPGSKVINGKMFNVGVEVLEFAHLYKHEKELGNQYALRNAFIRMGVDVYVSHKVKSYYLLKVAKMGSVAITNSYDKIYPNLIIEESALDKNCGNSRIGRATVKYFHERSLESYYQHKQLQYIINAPKYVGNGIVKAYEFSDLYQDFLIAMGRDYLSRQMSPLSRMVIPKNPLTSHGIFANFNQNLASNSKKVEQQQSNINLSKRSK